MLGGGGIGEHEASAVTGGGGIEEHEALRRTRWRRDI